MRSLDGMCCASQKLKKFLKSAAWRAKDATPRLGSPLPQMYSRLYVAMLALMIEPKIANCDEISVLSNWYHTFAIIASHILHLQF